MEEIKLNTNIKMVALSDLKPYEGSHNTDSVIDMLKESLDKYGFQQPIIIDKDNIIVAGTGVYKAAEALGMKEAPCLSVDYLTPDEVAQYRIADNKTSEFARWNQQKLEKEISYLGDVNELQYCFDEDLKRMLESNQVKMDVQSDKKEKDNTDKAERQEMQANAKESRFKDELKNIEESIQAKPVEYFEYTCSNCGKKVTVRL